MIFRTLVLYSHTHSIPWYSHWVSIHNRSLIIYLVGGIPTPLKNGGVRQLGLWNSQHIMENKFHVPNHQPDGHVRQPLGPKRYQQVMMLIAGCWFPQSDGNFFNRFRPIPKERTKHIYIYIYTCGFQGIKAQHWTKYVGSWRYHGDRMWYNVLCGTMWVIGDVTGSSDWLCGFFTI